MKSLVIRLSVLLLLSIGVHAANQTTAELLLARSVAKQGSEVQAALRMTSNPGWHTYWRNGGDAGFKTTVEWILPNGVTAGEFHWPVPDKKTLTGLESYVYEGEVILPFQLSIGSTLPKGQLPIHGTVKWLECSDENCVPASQVVTGTLTVGDQVTETPQASILDAVLTLLPKEAGAEYKAKASWAGPAEGSKRKVVIEWAPQSDPEKPDFFPYESDDYAISPATRTLNATADIAGLLLDRSNDSKAVWASLPIGGDAAPSLTARATTASAPYTDKPQMETTLLAALLLAFVGGMILNIMPCVLPVVALKVLGFVKQSGHKPRQVKKLGLIYGAGVLTSFLVLALLAVIVQRGGDNASWGMQMQNPAFVIGLMTILLLASLNLLGVFEFILGGSAMQAANELASREGASGAFMNGVFTTLLATPCTAPALTVALGFAYAQPPAILVLILLTVGLGLAFPYVLLCFFPASLKFLPKPGMWMEKFKKAMAFPLLATLAWLFWVATALLGQDATLWLGLYFVLLSLGAWIFGDLIQRGTKRKPLSWAVLALVILGAFVYALEYKLSWRNPPEPAESTMAESTTSLRWEKWSPEAVENARKAGHVVFVDFTAKWCLTCQANKKALYGTEEFAQKLKQMHGVAFIADFTRPSPQIAEELKRHNRRGVPLNLLFPADTSKRPIILPANVVKNTKPVYDALETVRISG
jgi:thiol:disulfide interchange protein